MSGLLHMSMNIGARSPLHCLDANNSSVPSSSSTSSIEGHPALRNEQHRRKLLGLHHAFCCKNVAHTPCSGYAHCQAQKRLFSHIMACHEGPKCIVPGCTKGRLIWTHFVSCTNIECSICSVITLQERKAIQPAAKPSRVPKSLKVTSSSPSRQSTGRPPLSPKARLHELPPRSPPRSPSPKLH